MKALTIAVIALAADLASFAQQRDVAGTAGTAEIAGVLVSAESQPRPIRRALITISSNALSAVRSAITDDAGRFTFPRLPAGTYGIAAKKAAYLQTEFGLSRPGRAGSALALKAGERQSVTLTMFKGAALSGVVRTPAGSPIAGMNVVALNVRSIGQQDNLPLEPTVTNDRGEYRIYGLMPGDYVVAATPQPGGVGEIGARSTASMDALLAALGQRDARPTAPPIPPAPPAVGYSPIYFPGTPLVSQAEKIRLAPGDDRDSVSFAISRVPVASVEGTVAGDVPSLVGVQMAIVPEVRELLFVGGGMRSMPISSVPPNENGEFKYSSLWPGKYQIVARARRTSGEPITTAPPGGRAGGGGRGGGGAAPGVSVGTGELMFAIVDLDINGQDIKGVNLSLQPGGSISGKLVFDSGGTPLPDDVSRIRIGVTLNTFNGSWNVGSTRIGTILSDVPPATVQTDGTFRLGGLGPALYTLTCTLPPNLESTWKLRSAVVDGRDLLDMETYGLTTQLRDVTLTLSDKRTELNGVLVSATGQPAADYFVIAFSTDRAQWRPGSRRSLSARPTTDGRFVFKDLPAGEYNYIAALTDLDPAEWQAAAFLEQVAPGAIKIRIAEGETKTQELRIR